MATAQSDQETARLAYLDFIAAMADVVTAYRSVISAQGRGYDAAVIAKIDPLPDNMDPLGIRSLLKQSAYFALHHTSQPLRGAAATDPYPRYDLLAGAAYASKMSPTPP